MDKIRLGRTEMMVSRLGFGGIPIQRDPEDEAVAVVKRCLELGINYIDTANAYTTSEGCIGKAIAGRRESVILATKSGERTGEGIKKHLKLSLERLGVDYIDLYQFHNVSSTDAFNAILAPDGAMTAVQEAKKEGLVRHIGITSHSMDTAKELVESNRFETIMFPFNFVTCEAADELLPLARERDMGFIVMKPLAGGMLKDINLAFKYLLQFPDVLPISGIERVPEIEEIVSIVEGPTAMTAVEQKEMERLRQELGTRFCRRCEYCQPCPADIFIPLLMNAPGFAIGLSPERLFSGFFAEAMEKAAGCTKCGECEEKCPYDLPIMEIIEERVNWYQEEQKKYREQSA